MARGLIKGGQLSGNLLHQGDLFHFFRDVGRTTQRLERRLQRLLKEETDAWDKWCAGRIYTKTLENVLAKVDTFLTQMEQYYQVIDRLSDAFWPIMDNGRLLTEKQAKRILADVIQRLTPLAAHLGLAELIKQIRNAQDHCLAYQREISYQYRLMPADDNGRTGTGIFGLLTPTGEVCPKKSVRLSSSSNGVVLKNPKNHKAPSPG